MKNYILLSVALLVSSIAGAQFRLSGTIEAAAGTDSLTLEIPFIARTSTDGDHTLSIDAKGRFSIDLDIRERRFAFLKRGRILSTLLLTPGRELSIRILKDSIVAFAGSAKWENMLAYHLRLNKRAFFLEDMTKNSPYSRLSFDSIRAVVIDPWFTQRDEKLAYIAAAPVADGLKRLFAQEVRAEAIHSLNYYARIVMNTPRARIDSVMHLVYDDVNPAPTIMPAGPQYYYFAESYTAYLEMKAMEEFKSRPASGAAAPLLYYGLAMAEAGSLVKTKGKHYLDWLLVKNNYDARVAEALLAQKIDELCDEKDSGQAKIYFDELLSLYPQSTYRPYLAARMAKFQRLVAANSLHSGMSIFPGYEKVTSLREVIDRQKGKVVYLDIWGTWCGPCREELKAVPALHERFAGKDVVFVYLDLDDDEKDAQWREFIRVNGMDGIHLRKNKSDIQAFWNELLPGKPNRQGMYPTYFIFDKTGTLVSDDAKRPSDKEALYQQLETYLK